MGAVIGVSSALGPLIGGLLIQVFGDTNGWRLVFVVNLPIGIVALIAAFFLLPAGSENSGRSSSVDFLGLLLLSGGLVAILVPLIEGQDQGWPTWTYLSLIGGVALIALFGVWEVTVAKRGKNPLVPPHLFSHPAFTGGVILALVYFAAFVSIFFTISILWQAGLGHTALESGLVSLRSRSAASPAPRKAADSPPGSAARCSSSARGWWRWASSRSGLCSGWCRQVT
jgi:Major Facilitator Superfamily.